MCFLTGCEKKTSPDEILDMYSDYEELDSSENHAKIFIEKGNAFGSDFSIIVASGNPIINQDENNAMVMISRCRLFDAENPEVEIETRLLKNSKTTTTNTGTSTHTFEGALSFSKDTKCDYLLLKFDGIPASESSELETPPLFYIIELGKNGEITILNDAPFADK